MIQAISLDARTMLVKADRESDLSGVIDFISRQDHKEKSVCSFLEFAAKNRKIEKAYQFNRESCYDR